MFLTKMTHYYILLFLIITNCSSQNIQKQHIQKNEQRKLDSNNNCSPKITNCEQCSDSETCTKCKTNFNLIEDNKCVYFTLTNNKFYYDESTQKYLSCSKINGCEECSSSSKCTKCQNGYKLKGDSCKDKYKKMKQLSIAAIVLSSIVIVGEIAFFVFWLINKGKNSENNLNNTKCDNKKIMEKDNNPDVIIGNNIYSEDMNLAKSEKKTSIHNQK